MQSKSTLILVTIGTAAALLCLVFVVNPQDVISGKTSGGTKGGGSSSSLPAGPHSIDLEKDQKQYLSILDRAQSGLDLTGDLTFEAWVKLESLAADNTNSTIIDKGSTKETSVAYRFYWRNTVANDHLNLFLSDDGSTSWGPTSVPYPQRTDEWTHLAATFDADTSKTELYVNGQPQANPQWNPSVYGIFANNQPFYIGSRAGTFDFTDGKIDEVRVWNIVRTPEDILGTYRQELSGTEPGLVGYWKFNGELVGGKMKDSSALGNHLQMTNAPAFSSDVPF